MGNKPVRLTILAYALLATFHGCESKTTDEPPEKIDVGKVKQIIRDRLSMDVTDSYIAQGNKEVIITKLTITSTSIIERSTGFKAMVAFDVYGSLLFIANTDKCRIDIEYDTKGEILKVGKYRSYSSFNPEIFPVFKK